MRRLVGGYRWGWVQYKMFAGDQGWIGLIRHGHMLHGTCLYELRRERTNTRVEIHLSKSISSFFMSTRNTLKQHLHNQSKCALNIFTGSYNDHIL